MAESTELRCLKNFGYLDPAFVIGGRGNGIEEQCMSDGSWIWIGRWMIAKATGIGDRGGL